MIGELTPCLNCNVIFRKKKLKQVCCNRRCMGKYLRKHTNEIIELYKTLKVYEISKRFYTSDVMIFKILNENSIPTRLNSKKEHKYITSDGFINLAKDLGLIK